jgi:hypothetical protein
VSVLDVQNKQVDIPLTGGLLTDIPTANVPPGLSPNNQDCDYFPRAVGTRYGIGPSIFPAIAGNPTINYLKTFEQPNLTEVLLSLDSAGALWQSSSIAGGLAQVNTSSGTGIVAGARGKSTSIFGREYIGLSDGKFGLDMPRQFDGQFLDRVSQVGPGASASSVVDICVQLTALSRTGGIISGTTASAHGLAPGMLVTIAGVNADQTFNGQFPVLTTPDGTHFTAQGAPGIFAISTISRAGNVVSAIVSGNPPTFSGGAMIVVAGVADTSYNGVFNVTAINGNIATWNQAGANSASYGGTLYTSTGSNVEPVLNTENAASIPNGSGQSEFVVQLPQSANLAGFSLGASVTIAGSSNASCDITAAIVEGPIAQLGRIYIGLALQAGGAFAGNGGTATPSVGNSAPTVSGVAGPSGLVSQGLHQVSVIFVTRQGAFLKPSPPIFWTANGGFQAKIAGIPTGPPNVVKRIIGLTESGGETFTYIQATTINDNVTTTLVVSATDPTLAGGIDMTLLFNQVELEECSGFIGYGSRLIAWGMRNYIQEFENLSFDGGFSGNTPLGWTTDPVNGAGGSQETIAVWWGDAYRITGDGAAAIKGMITQPAYQNYLLTQIIEPGMAYSARIRLVKGGGMAQGNAVIELYSPSLATSFGTYVVPVANIGATYQEFIGPLMASQASIPADLVLRYYLTGTPTPGGFVIADNLEIFPTNEPYNSTFARASGVDDPEFFDGVNGLLEPPVSEPIRTMFVLTDRSQLVANDHLYAVTDNWIFRTQDNGKDPSTWTWSQVSNKVGSPSINGVDVGEDWAAIAHNSGLYLYYFGSEPTKISQEVQTITANSPAPVAWDSINWQNGFAMWVKIDVQNKRVLIGAPINGAGVPNQIAMMNYRGLVSSSQIISTPPMHPSYTGRFIAMAIGRKWSAWTISANACWIESKDTPLAIPSVGAGAIFLGNSTGNGKIYNLTSANGFLDDGNNIPSYYDTAFVPSDEQKEQFGMLGSLVLLSYLRAHIEGSGNVQFTFFGPDYVNSQTVPAPANPGIPNQVPKTPAAPSIALSSPAKNDIETYANFIGERINVRIQPTGAAGSGPWFLAQKLELFLQPNPTGAIRGFN